LDHLLSKELLDLFRGVPEPARGECSRGVSSWVERLTRLLRPCSGSSTPLSGGGHGSGRWGRGQAGCWGVRGWAQAGWCVTGASWPFVVAADVVAGGGFPPVL